MPYSQGNNMRSKFQEIKLRADIASRLHIIASALESGEISLDAFDSFMIHVPPRFIARDLFNRYAAFRSRQNGIDTQQTGTSIRSDAPDHNPNR